MARTVQVTTRDLELFRSLLEYRYLTEEQIERIHFRSAQTAARRVRRLAQAGYLRRFRSPALDDRVVSLSPRGLKLVAGDGEVTEGRVRFGGRSRPGSELFLRHFAAVTDFRIALRHACGRNPEIDLLGFLPDFLVTRHPGGKLVRLTEDAVPSQGANQPLLRHVPDGVFALRRNGRAALFLLEIDCGTETVSRPGRGVSKLLEFYLRYLLTDCYQRYARDFGASEPFRGFRVLIVTSSRVRLENIRRTGAVGVSVPPKTRRFVWLADGSVLRSADLFAEAWVSLDPADETRYRMVRRPALEGG